MSKLNETHFNLTSFTLTNGNYLTRFWCNGTLGNINDTESVNFVINIPTPTTSGSSGGGGGSSSILECTKNSDCEEDEYCIIYHCVKIFDLKILQIDSPIEKEQFLDFTYYIKAIANINGDVNIDFWIEKIIKNSFQDLI